MRRLCRKSVSVAALVAAAAPAVAQPKVAAPPVAPVIDRDFEAPLPPLDSVAPVSAPATSLAPIVPPAELAQPLAPLATFDATPPPQTAAQAAQSGTPEKLRYSVQIVGLKEIGAEAEFRGLSALMQDGTKAANAAQVRARATEDVGLAERIMRSHGYYDGKATATVPPVPARDNPPLAVTIVAAPGTRYALGGVAVTQATGEPQAMALTALDLHRGDPIASDRIESGEARVALRLPEQGYPFAKVGQRDILLDGATFTGDYALPVDPGPKSSYGHLRTEGDAVFGLDHLGIFPRFRPGQTYDARKTDDLRQALVATGLFRTISAEPVATGETAPDGTQVVDVLVRQLRGKSHTISASGGYGTGEGIKATAEWTSRNFSPPEGALIVDVTGGTQTQAVSTTFRRSDAGKRDRTFQGSIAVSRIRYDAYKAQSVDVAGSIGRQSTPLWQKVWTYSVGAQLTATRETPFDPADLSRPKSTYFIAALPGALGYDRSNDLLNPTRGFRIKGQLTPAFQKQKNAGSDKYVTAILEFSGYYPVSEALVIAGRTRVSSIVGAPRDDIAPSRRLYAGGGGSVRGFGFQQLGPKDQDNNPIGGRSVTEFAIESRYRFGPGQTYGFVPFLDAGQVTDSSKPSVSSLRYGVGIGARYYTNFGPFRIDVATPLGRKKGESKIALYIGIGQAF